MFIKQFEYVYNIFVFSHDSPLVIALINKQKLSNQPRTEHLFSVVYLKNLPLLHLPINENGTSEETSDLSS